jgi:hypothetical protein
MGASEKPDDEQSRRRTVRGGEHVSHGMVATAVLVST